MGWVVPCQLGSGWEVVSVNPIGANYAQNECAHHTVTRLDKSMALCHMPTTVAVLQLDDPGLKTPVRASMYPFFWLHQHTKDTFDV